MIKRPLSFLSRSARAELASCLMHIVPDLMLVCRTSGTVTYQGQAAARNWSYPNNALVGMSVTALVHPDDRAAWQDTWRDRAHRAPVALRVRDGAGAWRRVEAACNDLRPHGIAVTFKEVAENALYDPLTGLPTTLLMQDRLQHALVRAARRPDVTGLLVIDLDGAGPETAPSSEALLIMAAGRLRGAVRAHDSVGRLAGLRFAVILEQLGTAADASGVARAIAGQFRRPFTVHGRDVTLTARIGGATSGGSDPSADKLWRQAEAAAKRAKSEESVPCVLCTPDGSAAATGPAGAVMGLRQAIESRNARIFYRPVVALPSGRVASVEAFASWREGTADPGLAILLGRWALEQSCLQLAEWRRRYPSWPALTLCARLSPNQLQRPFIVADIMQALLEAGLPASCLRLAIPEAAAVAQNPVAVRAMHELHNLGVHGVATDFDPARDSLADLKRLPLRGLGLHRACIQEAATGSAAQATLRQAVSAARSMFLDVTADGLDREEQVALLTESGADLGQGDHFGAPADARDMTEWLDRAIGRWQAA